MFECIPQVVPDSYLLTKAAYRAGEAWYQASSCPEATVSFAKAVELNDKDSEDAPGASSARHLPTARQHFRKVARP